MLSEPTGGLVIVACGTMPMLAGMRAILQVTTCDALGDMPAESRSTAGCNRIHSGQVAGEQAVLVLRPVCRSIAPEDLGQLNHGSPPEALRGLP